MKAVMCPPGDQAHGMTPQGESVSSLVQFKCYPFQAQWRHLVSVLYKYTCFEYTLTDQNKYWMFLMFYGDI